DPQLMAWIDGEAERFGWRTRSFDFLIERLRAAYEAEPTGAAAWNLYRALCRGGRWDEAAALGLAAQVRHGGTQEWRHVEEDLGRVLLLAGLYEQAIPAFDAVRKGGGLAGRRGAFYAAF